MLLCNMTAVSHYDVIMCLGNIWHLVIKVLSISQQKLKINSILLNWLQKCPTPLHFNAETKLCDDPQFAGCETMTTTTPAVTYTPTPPFITGKMGVILCLQVRKSWFFAKHHNSVSLFSVCVCVLSVDLDLIGLFSLIWKMLIVSGMEFDETR